MQVSFLKKHKKLKLVTKTYPEKRDLGYTEEDIPLKSKIIEPIIKTDREFRKNFKIKSIET